MRGQALMKCVRRFLRDQRGMEVPTLIMLMAFVGIPLIIALTQFSEDILGILSSAVDRLRPGD